MSLMTLFEGIRFVRCHGPLSNRFLPGSLVFLFYLSIIQQTLTAQLPQARLDTVFPPGGQSGSELEVSMTGENLDGLSQLLFSHPGIQSEIKPSEPSPSGTPPSFRVVISKDVPPGNYEVRTAGYFGVSNPRCFVVGNQKEIIKQGNPNRIGQAMDLPLETVLNGSTDAQSIDHFVIKLEAQHSYTIECLAPSIDSQLTPSLVLLDPRGKECARARSGGLIHFQAESYGQHTIQVHDALFQGGDFFYYRLRITQGPWIESMMPSSVSDQAGSHHWKGKRLPKNAGTAFITTPLNTDQMLPLTFRPKPGDAIVDGFDWRLNATNGISNPHFLTIASEPIVEEKEPNNTADQPQFIQPPCEISGTFEGGQDVDRFQFEANKGDVWWLEVVSNRIGQPTSPFLVVQKEETNKENKTTLHNIKEVYTQSKNPLGRLLDLTHRDPDWRFEATDDGIYQIRMSDLFQHANQSQPHPFRLKIRKPKPDFSLVVISSHPRLINNESRSLVPNEILLRAGMTWPLEVAVMRRDGFQGPIELRTSGLPEGVRSSRGLVTEGQDRGWIFLTTSTNAPTTWTSINVQGHAIIKGVEMIRQAKSATTLWTVDDYNNQPIAQRITTAQWIATMDKEPSPVVITPNQASIDVTLGKSIDIPLTVDWNEGAETGLKLKPVGLPSTDKLPELEIKPPETSYTYTLNLTDIKLPPGNYPLTWFGQTKIKYRNQAHVVNLYKSRLQEADNQLADAKSALQSAEQSLANPENASEQKETAEAQLESARKALKEAESYQATISQQVKEAEERAKPRDVDWIVYASPVTLHLSAASPQEESK